MDNDDAMDIGAASSPLPSQSEGFPGVSTPLPQVTSPSAVSSPSRATRRTPRKRGRENGTPRRRRSRSRSVGNPSYGSPGTPGTPGTPVATPAYHTPIGNVGTPFGTPVGTPSFVRGTPGYNQRSELGSQGRRVRRRRRSQSREPGRRSPSREPSADGRPTASAEPDDNVGGEYAYVWGTNVNIPDVLRAIRRFLNNYRSSSDDLDSKYIQLIQETVEREEDTVNIDMSNIFDHDPDLYNKILRYPLDIIPLLDTECQEVALDIRPDFEKHIEARPFNLKAAVNMRELNPSDIDKLVSVKGMVIRCSSIIPEIKGAFFKCLVCGHSPPLLSVVKGRVEEPTRCEKPECAARNAMSLIHNRCTFANKQIVRLQETPDAIPEGETPHTVSLCLYNTMVDAVKPGDRVEVTGVFKAMAVRVGPNQRTLRALYKTYIDCVHVKKADKGRMQADDPMEADKDGNKEGEQERDTEGDSSDAVNEAKIQKLKELAKLPDIYERLSRSLAPSIWELDDIKKGLLCQLFGGKAKRIQSGASFRGDINVLLVGDPGTSKSQLLQYVHKIAPRGIYTSGRGSSAVGLTAYVTKDPETRETVLESGALVLSDRGICCIDEFDKMSDNARSMLHEVMEQQTVSVAKAGIIASLNARTSVLACANPSGSRYNARLSVIDNIQLPPTLLSRFDLIYLMLDKPDEQNDRRLARHLVALHYENYEVSKQDALDLHTLTAYITYARQHINPTLSDEAAEDLINGYVEMRQKGNFPGSSKKVITATPRQLESMIRISEALARMRFSEVVERCDAAEAVRLLEVALQQSATDHATGTIDMDLITTGVSASERTRRANLVAALRELIAEKLSPGSSPGLKINQLLEETRKQSTVDVSLQDIKNALGSLQGEGFVTVHGDLIQRL
ncbi:hypothetical protein KC19_8G107300 [Ceratodon purpureus]|uniref:DNA replication licensing factor MCM4 n=1 Tax=Ceratodon purpureus TaxID=3225 RepID=A0A8T0H221_CERPU|nr:hypothetical protein KC19_8G107300 [Ceratodon purpureus]